MTIKLVEEKEVWDRFVDQSPYGLLFHKWDFIKIIEKHTNYKLLPYGIYNVDELICIFPLFFKRSKGIKSIFSPPARTGINRLGFIMGREFDTLKQSKKEFYLDMVTGDFDKEIKQISPNYISICLVPNFLDVRTFQWNNYDTGIHFTYTFDLDLPLEKIWNNFTKTLRSQIKNVDDSNLRLSQSNDISTFYDMEEKLYDKKGLKSSIISKNYLEDLFKAYPEQLTLYYLYDNDDDILQARINCQYKDRYIMWLGVPGPEKKSSNEEKRIYSNEYITWELIKKAKDAGYRKAEWGGGPKNISRFKSKFDPILETYITIQKKDSLGKFAEWAYLNFVQKTYSY